MARKKSASEEELMTDANIAKVIKLLEPEQGAKAITKKDACQIEYFHTFNELYQKRKQIVITSDKFPKDIPELYGSDKHWSITVRTVQ
jgi:hypothetical protein